MTGAIVAREREEEAMESDQGTNFPSQTVKEKESNGVGLADFPPDLVDSSLDLAGNRRIAKDFTYSLEKRNREERKTDEVGGGEFWRGNCRARVRACVPTWDPLAPSLGEDGLYNGARLVSSAWENGKRPSSREATRARLVRGDGVFFCIFAKKETG